MPTKKPLIGAAIVGQSGGPSSVINASAYGVIKTALEDENITKVYGAEHGIVGVLEDRLMIMDEEDPAELERLLYTPSSALGSCRYKIADPSDNDKDYKRILEIFEKYNVRYFFYIGGNDSMDTCAKISRYMAKVGYECRVIGVPKTIDNDLIGTDHCPGFASAAKYIATSVMEVARDCRVYNKGMITIIECMGRHAGWLTAATVLPAAKGDGPDLIYLPEVDFDMADFLDDVIRVYEGQGQCLVAVSEGIHYSDGAFVSEAKTSSTDGFGHAQLGGLAAHLAIVWPASSPLPPARRFAASSCPCCSAAPPTAPPRRISRKPSSAARSPSSLRSAARPARWSAWSASATAATASPMSCSTCAVLPTPRRRSRSSGSPVTTPMLLTPSSITARRCSRARRLWAMRTACPASPA